MDEVVEPTQDNPDHLRILIVDDEPDSLFGMDAKLHDSLPGSEIVVATNGDDALEQVKKGVHFLITDQRMPGISGLELIHAARALIPGLPVILTTAYPDLELAMRAVNEEHVDSFIVKPLDVHEVSAKIRQVLSRPD